MFIREKNIVFSNWIITALLTILLTKYAKLVSQNSQMEIDKWFLLEGYL